MNVAMSREEARSTVRWPWAVLGMFVVIAIVGMTLVVVNDEVVGEQLPFAIAFSVFGLVGALIVSRERRNRIGGLFLYGSCVVALSFVSGEIFTWLVASGTDSVLPQILGLLSGFGWLLGIFPLVFLLPLLFPDGRLPSPRWKPFLWFIVISIALLAVSLIFGEPELTGSSDSLTVDNPLYVSAIGDFQFPDVVFLVIYLGTFAASIASLFVRFRGSSGVERQQIKWVGFGFLAAFIATILADVVARGNGTASAVVGAAGFLAFPASVGIAVLRFRLYDLDVVVRKTLVAGVLAGGIAIVYAVVVAGGTALLGRDDPSLSVAAAVVLALAFQPARAGARRLADRVVYGHRATPYEVLTEFSGRVGDAFATDDVLARMAQTLADGTGASSALVWLEAGGELRPAGAYPSDTPQPAPVPVVGGELPALPIGHSVEVRDRGELLGALSVDMPAADPMTPNRERLVRDLASQAGLVLRNVRLVQDLRESRRRLVAAQDEERRRLERNIHDGAQQQLVALQVRQRLAEQLIDRDPAKAKEMLEQIQIDTGAALDDLRDLARGIYPPLLADKGLEAALESQARKATVPVTVDAAGVGRFSQEIEAAVYFSALEALQNTAKYAEARSVTITLHRTDDALSFIVTDDGRGFDPTSNGYGTGLQGIADRLGALEGDVTVDSAPGRGTVVSGRLPLDAHAMEAALA